jgi:hypothetical protein
VPTGAAASANVIIDVVYSAVLDISTSVLSFLSYSHSCGCPSQPMAIVDLDWQAFWRALPTVNVASTGNNAIPNLLTIPESAVAAAAAAPQQICWGKGTDGASTSVLLERQCYIDLWQIVQEGWAPNDPGQRRTTLIQGTQGVGTCNTLCLQVVRSYMDLLWHSVDVSLYSSLLSCVLLVLGKSVFLLYAMWRLRHALPVQTALDIVLQQRDGTRLHFWVHPVGDGIPADIDCSVGGPTSFLDVLHSGRRATSYFFIDSCNSDAAAVPTLAVSSPNSNYYSVLRKNSDIPYMPLYSEEELEFARPHLFNATTIAVLREKYDLIDGVLRYYTAHGTWTIDRIHCTLIDRAASCDAKLMVKTQGLLC